MYTYKKPNNYRKIWFSFAFMLVGVGFLGIMLLYQPMEKDEVLPVIKEEKEVVITLPDEPEIIILPFDVEANIVLEYYDGSAHEIADFTKFEDVYRPNQGIDYAFNGEVFEVKSMSSGEVSQVKNDEIFGHTISVTNGDLTITYQSLDAINLKEGDKVEQGSVLGNTSTNTYNAELGNHLHVVVKYKDKLVDPKTVIDKKISELE